MSEISKKQGCVVVAGHDLHLIERDFVILDKNAQFPLHLYQVVHDSAVQKNPSSVNQ